MLDQHRLRHAEPSTHTHTNTDRDKLKDKVKTHAKAERGKHISAKHKISNIFWIKKPRE